MARWVTMSMDSGLPPELEARFSANLQSDLDLDLVTGLGLGNDTLLRGQVPVIIAIEDVPKSGNRAYLAQLGTLSSANLQLNRNESVQTAALRLTRNEAVALAVRLTEILGPLDFDPADD